jgi:hypothetical protein
MAASGHGTLRFLRMLPPLLPRIASEWAGTTSSGHGYFFLWLSLLLFFFLPLPTLSL